MSYVNSVTTPLQQAARVAHKTTPKAKTMNIALWILQVLWGVFINRARTAKLVHRCA